MRQAETSFGCSDRAALVSSFRAPHVAAFLNPYEETFCSTKWTSYHESHSIPYCPCNSQSHSKTFSTPITETIGAAIPCTDGQSIASAFCIALGHAICGT